MKNLYISKFKLSLWLILLITCTNVSADLIFKSHFEDTSFQLNDTGVTKGADYLGSVNLTCSSDIAASQDCDFGRDMDFNDDSDGFAGFSFTKIDMLGNELLASASDWSCVKDNVTGLLWEVKSSDTASIHYRYTSYRWGGKTHLGSNYGTYYNDWDVLVDGSNDENLCGRSNWQVPTDRELLSLHASGIVGSRIDLNFFPYIGGYYLTSYPSAYSDENAVSISMFSTSNATVYNITRSTLSKVMLVSHGQ